MIENNIGNSKTKGYTRQRLDTVSVHTYGSSQYNYSSIPLAGQGVDARGVAQIRNPYLISRIQFCGFIGRQQNTCYGSSVRRV